MRLGFSQPDAAVVIALHLLGLTIVADLWAGRFDDAWRYLLNAGVNARVEDGRGIVFPLGELPNLAKLPGQVRVEGVGAIAPLMRFAGRTSGDTSPATVTVDGDGRLHMTFWDGPVRNEMELEPEAGPALLASELPFVATDDAWAVLEGLTGFPVLAGRASVNHDGYVEIVTNKPQVVESAPLPGLFKIDETRFGMALRYADSIDRLRGFEWVGVRPAPDQAPPIRDQVPVPLSAHAREDVAALSSALASQRAQVLHYDSGLGRRVVALSAVEVLDGWPLLIVAPPWSVWAWQRELATFGRKVTLAAGDGDVRLVTYFDLARGVRLDPFATAIFDDLSGPDATHPASFQALRRLGALPDAYRIGICRTWPTDPEEACTLLEVLRPGEFSLGGLTFVQRYPLRPRERAQEHIDAYLLRRADDAAPAAAHLYGPTQKSKVRVVPMTEPQAKAVAELETRPYVGVHGKRQKLLDAVELARSGPAGATGPKVGAALDLARRSYMSGRKVAVVTRSRRLALMARATLPPARIVTVGDDGDVAASLTQADVAVVQWTDRIPSLRGVDEVVVTDLPWSTRTLADALGPTDTPGAAHRVWLLHTPGTVDDRIAMYAARMWEQGVSEADAVPDDEAVSYLLTPRWDNPPT